VNITKRTRPTILFRLIATACIVTAAEHCGKFGAALA